LSRPFYPFVEKETTDGGEENSAMKAQAPQTQPLEVTCECRIAVYDDAAAAPRVVVIDPTDVRSYLEEITAEVTRLSKEQGGTIPFMVIREVVENLVHAYFVFPTISILEGGNVIRISDQGPGIHNKGRALEYGTTSATAEMRKYIRGVGSGLPYVQQYMEDKGGTLTIEDNIGEGTIVTLRARSEASSQQAEQPSPQPQAVTPPQQSFSAREQNVLDYLAREGRVGPSDLVREYGSSAPTWSRVLSTLSDRGIVAKQGQKYLLK